MAWFAASKSSDSAPANDPFSLDRPLLDLSNSNLWTIRDACEGTQVFGAIGSGKTSGSGRAVATAFLRAGYGGLVMTAKSDERDLWIDYCRETGRLDSLVIFSENEKARFNFMEYEASRIGRGSGQTESLVDLFYSVLDVMQGGRKSSDSFWEDSLRMMLRNAIDLLKGAGEPVTLPNLQRLILSAPQSFHDITTEAWLSKSFCYQTYKKGSLNSSSLDFNMAADYWLDHYPGIPDKTRGTFVTSFLGMVDPLLRETYRDLFCTTTNLTPEDTHAGKIIVLDLPVLEFKKLGRAVQLIFKYLWQRAAERRDVAKNPRPIFLWADESQYFISAEDQLFQSSCRSFRVSTVYLTQNLPNYYVQLSGDQGRSQVDSLLGNLQTKIFHANSDVTTNQWASNVIGQAKQMNVSFGRSTGGEGSQSFNASEALEFEVPPREFTRLKKGGPENGRQVQAIIFQGGRIWKPTGKNFMLSTFQQTDK